MSIQYRMSEAPPIRRSREQALSDLLIPDQSYGELVQSHLDAGTGLNRNSQWSYSQFEAVSRADNKKGISRPQLKKICEGQAAVSERTYEVILSVLGLPSGNHENDATPNAQESLANDLRRASGLFDEPTGPPDLLPPPLPPRPPLYRIPHPIPADLVARRSAVRTAIADLLTPANPSNDTLHLRSLAAAWPTYTLPEPSASATASEPRLLFVDFSNAIHACNSASRPWGDATIAISQTVTTKRRELCTQIARLLTILAWTPDAWVALPSAGHGKTLHLVVDGSLLTAGKEAAKGNTFSLPGDPTLSQAKPDGQPYWKSLDRWNYQVLKDIRAGVGIDHEIQLLNGLAEMFQVVPVERDGDTESQAKLRLAAFRRILGSVILAESDADEGRTLTLSEAFKTCDDPGFNEFFEFAMSLRNVERTSAVEALAFSGEAGAYLRGDETALLRQIAICRRNIAAIP